MIRSTQCEHPGKPLTTRRLKFPFPITHKEGTISCAGLLYPTTDLINNYSSVFLLILIMQDFSDYEFEKSIIRKAVKDIAFKSLRKKIQAAQEDRYLSTKMSKQFEGGYGNSGTQYLQQLWIARFRTYREHTLQKSCDSSLSGDDTLRPFDSIIIRLKSNPSNKPTISLAVMVFALQKNS